MKSKMKQEPQTTDRAQVLAKSMRLPLLSIEDMNAAKDLFGKMGVKFTTILPKETDGTSFCEIMTTNYFKIIARV